MNTILLNFLAIMKCFPYIFFIIVEIRPCSLNVCGKNGTGPILRMNLAHCAVCTSCKSSPKD